MLQNEENQKKLEVIDPKDTVREVFEIGERFDIGNQLITAAILKIELPDGSFVDNKDMILEFISQTPSNIVSELNDKIHELNNIGLSKELDYECECCHHQWKDTFFGFNQTDFFGIGS